MKTLKYSRQRESIKACLSGRTDHPTADTVYTCIRETFPNISLGTVYRNLNLLVDLGEIQKLTCGDGKDHFDWNPQPHYHFVCRCCGCVQDLDMKPIYDVEKQAQQCTAGRIEGHAIYFRGVCADCIASLPEESQ
jgi:Fur family peroxide stress response transcriptional regulator